MNQHISGGDKIFASFSKHFSSIYVNSINTTPLNNPALSDSITNHLNLNLFPCVLNATDVLDEWDTFTSKTNPGTNILPSNFFLNCKFVSVVPLLYCTFITYP